MVVIVLYKQEGQGQRFMNLNVQALEGGGDGEGIAWIGDEGAERGAFGELEKALRERGMRRRTEERRIRHLEREAAIRRGERKGDRVLWSNGFVSWVGG